MTNADIGRGRVARSGKFVPAMFVRLACELADITTGHWTHRFVTGGAKRGRGGMRRVCAP